MVDTNSIPSAAVQRVEVISGGASAVYGADAVGGVVNFILNDEYEGANLNATYGVTQKGDNDEYTVSGLIGAKVSDGRGHVMLGIEHSSRGKVLAVDRDWRVEEFNNPNVAGNDFWFSETFITSHSANNNPSQASIDAIFPALAAGTVPRNASFFINPTPDGTGTVFSGASAFTGATGAAGAYKYNGPLTRDDRPGIAFRKFHPNGQVSENALDQWSSIPLDRNSIFAKAEYGITDSINAIMQANFSRNRNKTQLGFAGAGLNANNARVPYGTTIYAPSLEADGITTQPAYLPGGLYGLNCPATGGCTESQAFPLPAEMQTLLNSRTNREDDIRINRNLDFMGLRRQATQTTTFQILAGLEGEFFDRWSWDLFVSHGQTETVANFSGFTSMARWRELVASPNFGRGFSRTGNELGAGRSAGTATCTTGLPVIADFEASEDCIKAMQANLQNNTQLEQNMVEGNVTGDILELPAGQLQFALGASYRDEEYVFHTDNLTTNESFVEQGLGLFPTSNTEGKFDVTEIYGELLIPVLKDLPFVHMLNLELGGRYSDYSSVGGVNTLKALGDWAFTPWARVRGGYQLANRAPNLGELFLSRTQVFGNVAGAGDQCSENLQAGLYSANPSVNKNGAQGAAFTKALCRLMMGQTAADEYYGRPVSQQPRTGGAGLPNTIGNRNLDNETAHTWTAGLVISSPLDNAWLQRLSVSIDYYQIRISDMIAVEDSDAVFQRCLDPAINTTGSPDTEACSAFTRDPITGTVVSTDLSYTNLGRAFTSGLDVQLDWSAQFEDLGLTMVPGGMSLNVLANVNLKNTTQASPVLPVIDWVGTQGCALGLQCMQYQYRIFTTLGYFVGAFNATLRWQHYPSIESGAYATNPNTTVVGVRSTYDVFALSLGYRINDQFTVRGGIDNLFNRKPPLSGGDPNASGFPRAQTRQGGAFYDPLGRRGFINLNVTW